MNNQRAHHVTTTDGVTIGAAVHGRGPNLVFLQGIIGDGDLDWQALVPHLADGFTCHVPSLRGRGLSGDHPDHSFGRLVEDVVTYVDSLEALTGLVGWSLGADMALPVAAQSGLVKGVVCVEPVMPSLCSEQELAALGGAVAQMGELAAEGKLADGARAFARFPLSEEDIAAADEAGYFEAAARYVPKMLDFFEQQREHEGPPPEAASAALGAISAPVLVLHGSETKPFAPRAARHVTEHAPNARVREIAGAGHAAPLTHSGPLAAILSEFFSD